MEEEAFGRRSTHELLPGGADVAVTDANKLLYVHLAADWHLNGRLGAPAGAFAAGLHQVGFCKSVTILSVVGISHDSVSLMMGWRQFLQAVSKVEPDAMCLYCVSKGAGFLICAFLHSEEFEATETFNQSILLKIPC